MRPVFNAEAIAWCTDQLATFAAVLNEHPAVESATPDYHLMADGVVWSDEHVEVLGQSGFNKFFCIVVNIRTSQIKQVEIGAHAEKLMAQLRDQCNRWAFCEPRRFDATLDSLFEKLAAEAGTELKQGLRRIRSVSVMEKWLDSIRSRIQGGSLLPSAYFASLNCDVALESRDTDEEFDTSWARLHAEIERLWASATIEEPLRKLAEDIRKESFLAVSGATQQHEIASYVSDDFDLIVRGRLLGLKDPFLKQLWRAYDDGTFPTPPLQGYRG